MAFSERHHRTWKQRRGEREFRLLVGAAPQDPDLRLGLASALGREERWKEALRELDAAVEVDPKRADLHAARGRALRALRRTDDARQEFVTALRQEPASEESRAGLLSVRAEPKHELRLGTDTNLFNFAGTYQGEWVSLTSHWKEHWGTSFAGNFYQRNATIAGKFIASATGRSKRWGGLTLGGASAHDVAIIPETEAFYGYDRGWRIGESGFLRGAEAALEEHWYWFTAARILTLNGTAAFYFSRDWTWSLSLLGARSRFSSTAAAWRPSGTTRLGFPLAARGERKRVLCGGYRKFCACGSGRTIFGAIVRRRVQISIYAAAGLDRLRRLSETNPGPNTNFFWIQLWNPFLD